MAGRTDLKVELGPELYIKGRITGDLDQLTRSRGEPVVQVHRFLDLGDRGSHSSGEYHPVVIEKGAGTFEVTNLWPGKVKIEAGDQHREIDLEQPLDELAIHLEQPSEKAEGLPQPVRTVLFQFQVPEGMPPPSGHVSVQYWNDQTRIREGKSLAIENGMARFEVPVPGRIEYEPAGMVGYWFKGESYREVPKADEPFVIDLPLIPAGAIYGEVVNHDGSDADYVLISVVEVEKAPAKASSVNLGVDAKDSAGTGDGPTRFTAQPLPLGGRYMLVARRNSKLVVSPVFHLTEAQPVREIRLQLAQGMTLQGEVTDDTGQPVAGVKLELNYDTTYHHGFSGIGNAVSDQEGGFQFDGINPDVPGYYTVTVQDRAGFRPHRKKTMLDGSPISVCLEWGA
jgi:hypothetical protein